jgi:hypothetical protein
VGLQPTGLTRGGDGEQRLGRCAEQQVIDHRLVLVSVSCSSRCVAKLCRSVRGDTRFLTPAASAAAWTVESGSTGLRPGNSQPRDSNTPRRRPSRHQARSSLSSCGDSMAWRSLRRSSRLRVHHHAE